MMINDKNLVKIHGSSVMTMVAPKPNLVCCQDLVLSTITGRPMARTLIPISRRLLEECDRPLYLKTQKMVGKSLPQKVVKPNIPNSFLMFFRSKNHNQTIQKKLIEQEAYLETDEDEEKMVYFYLADPKNPEQKLESVQKTISYLHDYAKDMIFKKQFLLTISDRTKMQINEFGQAVDILTSREFLSFLIKAKGKEYTDLVEKTAFEADVDSKDFYVHPQKEKEIILVHFKNKKGAKEVFNRLIKLLRKRNIGCFPLCGSSNDCTAKFKKWKIELVWYEGKKSSDARINFSDYNAALECWTNLKGSPLKKHVVNKYIESHGGVCFIDFKDVIGRAFKDEIDFENQIQKFLRPENSNSFKSFVYRQDNYSPHDNSLSSEDKNKLNRAVKQFVDGAEYSETPFEIDEFDFVQEIGMTRDVVQQLDFKMRKQLQTIFPKLKKLNIFCFKRKADTLRRALIFPKSYGYQNFIENMIIFSKKYNEEFIPELNSRVRISFKGEYVLKIDDDTYRNFSDKIQELVASYSLFFKVRHLMKKREIIIRGSYDKFQEMGECVKEVMGLLYARHHPLDPALNICNFYALKSKAGQDKIDRLNNKFNKRAFGRFDTRSNRLLLRGTIQAKEDFVKRIESFMANFNNKIKKEYFSLKDPRKYFKNMKKIQDMAYNSSMSIRYVSEKKQLEILYDEYMDMENRQIIPNYCKTKSDELEKFKSTLQNMLEKDKIVFRNPDKSSLTTSSISCIKYSDCSICGNTLEEPYRLFCSHSFCKVCIRQYILDASATKTHNSALSNPFEDLKTELVCPEPSCGETIVLVDFLNLGSTEELQRIFMYQKVPFLLKNSDRFKPCPTPDCNNILVCPDNPQTNDQSQDQDQIQQSQDQPPNQTLNQPPSAPLFSPYLQYMVFCDTCGNDTCFKCLKTHHRGGCNYKDTQETNNMFN